MAKLKLFLIGILVAVAGYLFQEFRYIPHIDCPIINTTLGSLRGYTSVSRDGREFFSFLGIPFAQPPIGPLRFEVFVHSSEIQVTRHCGLFFD